jgi:SAM-dependent methyltransferase
MTEPVWRNDATRECRCPICPGAGQMPLWLEIDSLVPPHPRIAFVRCPACESIFQWDFRPPPYGEHRMSRPSLKYYVEQGAGLDTIVLPAMIAHRQGRIRRYLEVGCGFGFGLDFAGRVLGWTAHGFDPSPLAGAGRECLGVDIESRYFGDPEVPSTGEYDAAAAVEVLEHVERPHEFLGNLRSALEPEGLLVLTTPDASYVEFGRRKPGLLAVLSPGYHAILYSRKSLDIVLRRGGFTECQIETRGASLLAVAGERASQLDLRRMFAPRLYVRYLRRRLRSLGTRPWGGVLGFARGRRGATETDHETRLMLELGFAYRLFKHLVSCGHYARARHILPRIAEIVRRRDGVDILSPEVTRTQVQQPLTFVTLVERFPACLPGLLFFHGVLRLNHGHDRVGAGQLFRAAHEVAARFGAVMRADGVDDGEIADLERRAEHHLQLVAGAGAS